LLAQKAVAGRVVEVDRSHKEVVTVRASSRPLVKLLSAEPCLMPPGKELYWSEQPGESEFVVHAVAPAAGGALVRLTQVSKCKAPLPAVGATVCFSVMTTAAGPFQQFPDEDPWTHAPAGPAGDAGPIEEEDAA